MKIFFWLWFIVIITAFCFAVQWQRPLLHDHLRALPAMTGLQVVVFALAIAFTWVEVLKWWKHVKPFNCLKCMTGWVALILAFTFHVQFWPLYLPLGLFVGAVFGAIKMRYL